jgi:di/tripeptidase
MYNSEILAQRTFKHLQDVVRIESASDETSESIPSTQGQVELAKMLAEFFGSYGGKVESDRHSNVIATFAGRGALAGASPIALMVHLDTARGTHAVDSLHVVPNWDGSRIPYPANEAIQVTTENYPWLERMLGLSVVHGPGDAPFGLDDKLGMAHLMTVATMAAEAQVDHVPFILICRPDEEIGRHAALEDLAKMLAERGIRHGYTIDGLDPYEVNLENFNASVVSVDFPKRAHRYVGPGLSARIGGVNTHGATAKTEQHRTATRFTAEVLALLADSDVLVADYSADELRDCDASVVFTTPSEDDRQALLKALNEVVGPHVVRGASLLTEPVSNVAMEDASSQDGALWIGSFINSGPGFPLLAEDSDGREGYSHPFMLARSEAGHSVTIRVRDFDMSGLETREALTRQYVNMGPEIAKERCLEEWALAAGKAVAVESEIRPIRGGTGVDPLLDEGVYVANLGTGYFAPESEKELTCLEWMGGHAAWIFQLLQVAH